MSAPSQTADRGNSVVDRVHRQVEAVLRGPAAGASSLVVAVSGGPDSMALLHALLHLRGRMGLSLRGAHLDHGLRGDAGAADAAFVADIFADAGVPYDVEKADVAAYRAAHRLSLEQAAREVRYAFLARVYREHGADAVALGHTADDQGETILMHVVRGSGLTGLRGMEPWSSRPVDGTEVRFVRPLLGLPRADTEAYCRALGLRPRTDESNRSPDFTRNRVRTELLPLLEELNPAVRDALLRLSTAAARELSYLDAEVDRLWEDAAEVRDDRVALDRSTVARLPKALRTHVLRRAVAAVKGDLDGVHLSHADDMMRLLKGPAGRAIDLPGGLRFHVGYDEAIVARADADLCPLPRLDGEHPLTAPGETRVGAWTIVIRLADRPDDDALRLPRDGRAGGYADPVARMSLRALAGGLVLRTRRPGDSFHPLGAPGRKKLQDFMVDAKVPASWRDRVPLVVTPRGIAWVAGWRIAEWCRVTPEDRQIVEISLRADA